MAIINISLKNIFGDDITSTQVKFKLLDDIIIDSTNIVAGTIQSVTTNSSGDATTSLYSGNYLCYILDRKPLKIAVPGGNVTLNLTDLIDDDNISVVTPSLLYVTRSELGDIVAASSLKARVVSELNGVNSGLQSISGVSLVAGDLVLRTAQTNPIDNGLWTISGGAWTIRVIAGLLTLSI
jgi:hypothetical protein